MTMQPRRIARVPTPTPPTEASPASPSARASFEALIRAHYAALVDYVTRIVGSPDTAEDVVQDLFVRLWDQREDGDFVRDPVPYLFRSARNRAVSQLRHERIVLKFREREAVEPSPASPTPFESLHAAELLEQANVAIEALPPRCREVFRLSRQQGLSHAEVARTMGISTKTVEVQISKALRALWARLAPFL